MRKADFSLVLPLLLLLVCAEAAIRYSQWVCADRTPTPASLQPTPDAAPPTLMAGGRNAPVLLRQLSATTLPPSALGFICRSSSSFNNNSSSSGPVPAWTPFSAAAAAAADTGANSSPAVGGSNGSSRNSGTARDDATPLLPLTYSDEISIDVTDTDATATATDGAFNFKLVFQQMLPSTNEAPSISFEQHSRVVSMDQVLARLPRGRNVRLYPVTARNNVMWEAVQQAFAFFSTSEGAAAVAAAGAAASGSNGAAAAGGLSGLGGTGGMSESMSSIQSLNLTQSASRKQLLQTQQQQGLDGSSASLAEQQQQLQRDGSSASTAAGTQLGLLGPVNVPLASATGAAGSGSGLGAVVAQRVSRMSTASAADSPTKAAAAAAAAAAGSQLLSAISNLGTGAKGGGAGNPALSGLNDILEIRTDVESVRMISSPDQPPQVGCNGSWSMKGSVALLCSSRVTCVLLA